MNEEQKDFMEKEIDRKKMEEEIKRGIDMEKQLLQKNETTSTDNSLRDENEHIIIEKYRINDTEIGIKQDLIYDVDKTLINKQIQPENQHIEIQKSKMKNIKNESINENKTIIINDYENNNIDDTKKKREINVTQMTTEMPKHIMKIEQLSNDKENKVSIQNGTIKIEEQKKNKTTGYKENQDEFKNHNITNNLTEIKNQTIIKSEPLKSGENIQKNFINQFGMIWRKAWAARRM